MIFRSAEKTFFLSASCSADVRLWVEKALEGKVKNGLLAPCFSYLDGICLQNPDVRMSGRCHDVLTCFRFACACRVARPGWRKDIFLMRENRVSGNKGGPGDK